jgi:hypothetical protein
MLKQYMKQLLLVVFVLFQFAGFSQTGEHNFSHLVMEVEGDLNKDNLADKVVITQDTAHENAPYRLQIFFKKPDGKWKLAVTSTKIIVPQYPEGRSGFRSQNELYDVTVKNGVLILPVQFLRGNAKHKFRFQNGNFELIGYSSVLSGQGEMETTDFNLSTGTRTIRVERYDSDKLVSSKTEKILIRPLPKLQDLVPFEGEYY